MINNRYPCAILGALLFLVLGCKDSKDPNITIREETVEETAKITREVFKDNIPENNSMAESNEFFMKLGAFTLGKGSRNPEEIFSLPGMISAIDSTGSLDGLSTKKRRDFEKGFRNGIAKIANALKQMGFKRYKIFQEKRIDDDEMMVFVRLYHHEYGNAMSMRWWLIKTDEGWKAYDFEDLTVGLRSINIMATILKAGMTSTPEPWIKDFQTISVLKKAMDYSDLDSFAKVEEALVKLRKHKLPADLQKFSSHLMTICLIAREDAEEGIEELKRAKKGGYESPLYHYHLGNCLYLQGEHQKALNAFEEYSKLLGYDSDVYEMVSDCHLALDNRIEARKAALDGLADNPAAQGCVASLTLASTPEEIKADDFLVHFTRFDNPDEIIEFTMDYLLADDLYLQAEALLDVARIRNPEGDIIEFYEDSIKEGLKKESE